MMLMVLMTLLVSLAGACPNTSTGALADCYRRSLAPPAPMGRVDVKVGEESHGSITRLIDASPAAAADALMRFDEAPGWFPALQRAAILQQRPGEIRVEGSSALPWPLGEQRYEMELRRVDYTLGGRPAALVTFRYVEGSGDIEALYGYWLLVAAPGGRTIVQYETNADLGFWLPEALVGFFTGRALPQAVAGLERAAQAG